MRTPDNPSRLRSYENPPWPPYEIEILRKIMEMNESLVKTVHTVEMMGAELQKQGAKLEVVVEIAHDVKGLKTIIEKQDGRLTKIEDSAFFLGKGPQRAFAWMAGAVALAVGLLELYKYFHPAIPPGHP